MMTDLDRWTEYWKQRLKLRDWKITVRFGRPYVKNEAGEREKCLGTATWNPGEMTAEIILSRKAGPRDLAHEILHIALQGEDDFPGHSAAMERSIERIVNCLFEVGGPNLEDGDVVC